VIRMSEHMHSYAANALPQPAAPADGADEVHAALVALVRALARSEARRWVAEQSIAGGPCYDEV
jgi:hypothetical protein